MRILKTFMILCCCCKLYAQDSVSVYFALGSSQLNAQARQTLDALVYDNVLAKGRKVGILGYADITGGEQDNLLLSQQRAQSVQRYLQGIRIDSNDIETITGKGEIKRAEKAGGYPEDRKVVIIPGGFNAPAKITKPGKAFKIDISKIVVNGIIRLENIYFYAGSGTLKPESEPTLEMLYAVLRDNPALKIRIEGHVCCNSPDAIRGGKLWVMDSNTHNLVQTDAPEYKGENLSEKRARAVYDYLIKNGISASRISHMGFGSRRMIVNPERNEADRDRNRRVEVRILEK